MSADSPQVLGRRVSQQQVTAQYSDPQCAIIIPLRLYSLHSANLGPCGQARSTLIAQWTDTHGGILHASTQCMRRKRMKMLHVHDNIQGHVKEGMQMLQVQEETQVREKGGQANKQDTHLAPSVGVAVGERDLQQHDGGQLNSGAREARVQLIFQFKRPPAALRKHMVYCGRVVLHLHGHELCQPL